MRADSSTSNLEIDEKLLVQVAGIDVSQARFLCTGFKKFGDNRSRKRFRAAVI